MNTYLNSIMRRLAGAAGAGLLVAFLPFSVSAETVVRTGNSVSVEVDQMVENDFYAAGGSVSNSGQIKADMSAVAGSLTVNGQIGADLLAVGGTVQVHAPVKDDVRVVAGETVIASDIGGDVFVIGGTLKVLSSAKIAGDVYFYGGDVEIAGIVKGRVMGRAESFTISSAVGGVDVGAVKVELLEGAAIAGDVSYSSPRDLYRAPGVSIGGEIVKGAMPVSDTEANGSFPVVFFAIWLFTTFCFFLLFRTAIESVLAAVKKETLKMGLVGAVAAVAGPVIGIVLMATVLGIWLGVLKILLSLILFIVTMTLLPIMAGGYALSWWKPNRRLDAVTVVTGMAIVMVATVIPVVGGLLIFVGYAVTLGAILYLAYQKGRGLI
jgi:cytoskeletal protein CcmA (bactofilin family)